MHTDATSATDLFDIPVRTIDGAETTLAPWRGQVLLVVNTASQSRLKHAQPGLLGSEKVKWNFTKFLVDRAGRVVARHAPQTAPEKLDDEVAALLRAPREGTPAR